MKTVTNMLAAIALASTTVADCAVAAKDVQKLSGAQIRAKFTGMQLTDEVHYRDVYDRDGTLRSYAMGTHRVGKWVIDKDELCQYFQQPDDGCFEVILTGDRIEMKPSGLGLSIEGILQKPTDRN